MASQLDRKIIRPCLRKKIVVHERRTCVPKVNVLNNNLPDYVTSLSEWTFHINTSMNRKQKFKIILG